ncbi:MAG TPA: hypothetical protein VMN03_02370 [Burkholderiales bacterium]|nr:hypothetical protein [Burkholderiales bacterium]
MAKARGIIFIGASMVTAIFGTHALAQLLPLKDAPVPGWPRLILPSSRVTRRSSL